MGGRLAGKRGGKYGFDCAAGGDSDDLLGGGGGVWAAVAGEVVGRDVGDGAVVGRGADGVGYGVGLATCVELDEDGMGRCRRGGGQEGEALHCVWASKE